MFSAYFSARMDVLNLVNLLIVHCLGRTPLLESMLFLEDAFSDLKTLMNLKSMMISTKKAMRLVVVGMNHTFDADISIMEKSSSFISLEARAYSSNDNP
jgi:hypothetical protein